MIYFGILLLLLGAVAYSKYRNILHPLIIFNLWWAIIIIVDSFDLSSLNHIGGMVQYLIVIGSISFNLGCILSNKKNNATGDIKQILDDRLLAIDKRKVNKVLTYTQIILIILMIPLFVKMIPYYLIGDAISIRATSASGVMDDGTTYMSTFERMFYQLWIVFPLAKSLFTITTVLWLLKVVNNKTFFVSIISALFVILDCGNRLPAFFFALIILFASYILYKGYSTYDLLFIRNRKRVVRILLIVAIGYMVYNGIARSDENVSVYDSVAKSFVDYFTGGMHLLEYAFSYPHIYGLDYYSWGLVSFHGPIGAIFDFLYYATGGFVPLISDIYTAKCLDESVFIGPYTDFNAFPTMYYFFYRDLGGIGVIILSFIFGQFSIKLYKRLYTNPTILNISLYLELLFVIIFSVCWWWPFRQDYFAQILYYFIALKLLKLR